MVKLPDNVFQHRLGKNIDCIETPLNVVDIRSGKNKVVNAVWDTDSTSSAISKRVADSLGLGVDGISERTGTGGSSIGSTTICLSFPGCGKYAALIEAGILDDVAGVPDFIVGLDIITMGSFRLANENGESVLTFTFDKSVFIDCVSDTPDVAARKMNAFWERIRMKHLS